MTETEKQIKEIHGMMTVLVSDSKAMKKTLYGNGQPGLTDRTTILEQAVSGFKGFGKRLTTVETKQSNCVAAKGHVRSTVIFAITIIASAVSVLTLVASVVSKFFWHV